ncbi:MAG: hypothetical protein Q8P41_02035 [Pseudomonadota bacterium]|nr:hypothetical protein [Pseudomonadota bacterium]
MAAVALALVALLGCSRGAALTAPVELAWVAQAGTVRVSAFLAPTALGAADDTLCGWARGAAPPANVARWVAEGRLRFRVLVADGPEARVWKGAAGPLSEQLTAVAGPENALAERCGTERARGILVLADREASYGAVADAVELARVHGGYLDAWLAVDTEAAGVGAAPGFQAGVPVVALVAPDGRVALSNREGRGYEGAPGALGEALAAVGAPGKVGCATISGRPALPWATALAAMDGLRGDGVDLQALDMEGAPGAAPETRATPPARAARTWPLDGTVAAVPVRTLSQCGEAPVGWWCHRLCAPQTFPETPVAVPPGERSLGELVYTARRIVLVERGRTEPLYDDGVIGERGTGYTAPCASAVAERWLAFEAFTESGVLTGAGAERGALSSLNPAFDDILAAVRGGVAWRTAIEADAAPWAEIRGAVEGEGPRAVLAWEALVNPAWHDGGVDGALRDAAGEIRGAPAAVGAGEFCARR